MPATLFGSTIGLPTVLIKSLQLRRRFGSSLNEPPVVVRGSENSTPYSFNSRYVCSATPQTRCVCVSSATGLDVRA